MSVGAPGVVCRECLGRIDERAIAFAKKAAIRLRRKYAPPKLCTECAVGTLLRLAFEDEP